MFLFSIDTEEDNWAPTRNPSVENIGDLRRFHAFLRGLGIRPTYFTAYQVLLNPWAAAIMQEIAADDDAELGAHLHPWNTPPVTEPLGGRNTMLSNLSAQLQREKLTSLTERFTETIGTRPTSFRAGRFGIGPSLIPALIDLGYLVDSSVTPNWNWSGYDGGPNFNGAPVHPYRLGRNSMSPNENAADGELVELPVSVGYNRLPFSSWGKLHDVLDRRPLSMLHATGVASRTGLLKKIILSPETETSDDLLHLSRRILEMKCDYLHMFLHSSSLRPGLTPFTRTAEDLERLYANIERYVVRLREIVDIEPITASAGLCCAPPIQSSVRSAATGVRGT